MNIRVNLKKTIDTSYTVTVEQGLFKKIPKLLREKDFGRQYCIITDTAVQKIYGNDLLRDMKEKGLPVSLVSVPAGEKSKTLSVCMTLGERLLELGVRRDSCIIALGGGVISDLAGFMASVYMRGIPFVVIPTTLLSAVDASIGGKTGVDLAQGKNLIGTFHQPKAVFIDPNVLKTLSSKERRNGLAEMVKHAVIKSRPLFLEIERNVKNVKSSEQPALWNKLIIQNIKIKAGLVKQDERESVKKKSKYSRMLLNYGHTIGHAIETLSHYTIPHGEAISIGMVMENIIAVKKNLLSESEAERIKSLLSRLGLPIKLPSTITPRKIQQILMKDKKMIGGKVHFVLPVRIGQAVVRDDILA